MNKKFYLILLLSVLLVNAVSVNASTLSDNVKNVLEEKLATIFESNGSGGYQVTHQILDSSKIEGSLKDEYDEGINNLMDGNYTFAYVKSDIRNFETSYSDDYNKIGGFLTIDSCELTKTTEKNIYVCDLYYSYSITSKVTEIIPNVTYNTCGDDSDACTTEDYNTNKYSLTINLVKNTPNQKIINQLYNYYNEYNISKDNTAVIIKDLSYINLLLANNLQSDIFGFDEKNNLASYASEVYRFFPDGDVNIYMIPMDGKEPTEIEDVYHGILTVMYGDVLYDFLGVYPRRYGIDMIYGVKLFYVPQGTLSSNYAQTVKQRITNYLNNSEYTVNVETDGNDNYDRYDKEDIEWFIGYIPLDLTNINKKLYTITITKGSQTYSGKILIDEGTTNDLKEPEVNFQNYQTKVLLRSSNAEVPIDSVLDVNMLDSGQRYEKLKELLKGKNFDAYSFLLTSKLKGTIKTLVNGEFHIYIPVPQGYDEKVTKIYYFNDENNLEKYDIIGFESIDNVKYAHFKTNHFSDYVLVNDISNPKTGEGSLTLIFSSIALFSIVVFSIIRKKGLLSIN